MVYKIIFGKQALDFINKLEKIDKDRIWKKLQKCKEEPFRFLQHLEEINGFKLRIGDYRLVIDIHHKSSTLIVTKAGHRKNIYDN